MRPELIFLPVTALVLLTVVVWVHMYVLRIRAIRAQRLNPQLFTTRASKPALGDAAAPADNFQNLLEAPVLFYAGALVIYVTGNVDTVYLAFAWGFVALRYAHSIIHVSYNRVLHRFAVYTASCLVLWLIWLRLGVQLFL